MLKPVEIYTVAVCLNTLNWNCTLQSKPDGATLLAVADAEADAEAEDVDNRLIEALTFVSDIATSKPCDDGVETKIIVADVEIGTVHVKTNVAYTMTPKRVRKPQVSTQTTD